MKPRPRWLKPLLLIAVLCLLYGGWWTLKWKIYALPRVTSLAYAPDAKLLAGAGGWFVPHDGDPVQGAVWLWDAQTGVLRHRLVSGKAPLVLVAFSQDGHRVIGWQRDRKWFRWEVATGQLLESGQEGVPGDTVSLREIGYPDRWRDDYPCRFTPSGCRVARKVIDESGPLFKKAGQLTGSTEYVLALSPASRLFATERHAARPEKVDIVIRELATGRIKAKLPQKLSSVRVLRFSPDGQAVFLDGRKPEAHGLFVWHFASPKVLEMKDAEVRFPLTLVFSPDGKQVAAGGMYGNVQLWDTQTGKSLASWQGS